MGKKLHITAAGFALTVLVAQGITVAAEEIKVMAGAAFRPVIVALGPQFERATGHKLVTKYEAAGIVARQIESGEPFDLAILNPSLVDDLIKKGKIAAGSKVDISRAAVGVAARAGAAKPDISTVEAFKRTLLSAKSVAYSKEGTSGIFFAGLLERLGIAEQMKPKLVPLAAGELPMVVARGEAEIGVAPIPPIIMAPGIQLIGALPPDLQSYIVYTAGIGANAPEAQSAAAFIRFLTSEVAFPALKATGMERVAP